MTIEIQFQPGVYASFDGTHDVSIRVYFVIESVVNCQYFNPDTKLPGVA